jgi:tetratricopeptide (TPR) repeat protein
MSHYFHDMNHGRFKEAYEELSGLIAASPKSAYLYANRSISLLCMRNLEQALVDLLAAERALPFAGAYYSKIGVVYWWLGRTSEAVEIWRQSLFPECDDSPNGIDAPTLLLFAASQLRDPQLEDEATTELRKQWEPSRATVWPWPIAGFLLGDVDEEEFLLRRTFLNPTLEARRLVRAHFWVGLAHFRQGHIQEYFDHLRRAVESPPSIENRFATMLEGEYWLAQAELSKRQ